jgi:hypothetical protein
MHPLAALREGPPDAGAWVYALMSLRLVWLSWRGARGVWASDEGPQEAWLRGVAFYGPVWLLATLHGSELLSDGLWLAGAGWLSMLGLLELAANRANAARRFVAGQVQGGARALLSGVDRALILALGPVLLLGAAVLASSATGVDTGAGAEAGCQSGPAVVALLIALLSQAATQALLAHPLRTERERRAARRRLLAVADASVSMLAAVPAALVELPNAAAASATLLAVWAVGRLCGGLAPTLVVTLLDLPAALARGAGTLLILAGGRLVRLALVAGLPLAGAAFVAALTGTRGLDAFTPAAALVVVWAVVAWAVTTLLPAPGWPER